ncbi:MAG: hypothetical protein Q8K32_02180 [Archangium sp.]|nr:hypothetical protein [Archangium sp.]
MNGSLQGRLDRALHLLAQGVPPASVAKELGLSARALDAWSVARPGASKEGLEALSRLGTEVARRERTLRAAATWPLVLLVAALLSSAVVWSATLPALSLLPLGGGKVSLLPAALSVLVSSSTLLFLGLGVLSRARLPGLQGVWSSIDRHAFATCTHVLHAAGVPLTDSLRAAARWLPAYARPQGEDLARSLEAGGAYAPRSPAALDPVALGMLLAAAKSGTATHLLAALRATTQVTMAREVPREVSRLHTASLVLAGLATGANFATFYFTYVRAVTG